MQNLKIDNISKINDIQINEYLNSRNLKFNTSKMVNYKIINNLDHYFWWFNNNRNIFSYKIDRKKNFFFWDQIISFKKKKFIIGGWHSNYQNTNLYLVLFFQKWQINRLKNSKLPWIAVVKKSNKIVYRLCKYLGYTEIKNEPNKWHKIIKDYYKVQNKNFYYLILKTD